MRRIRLYIFAILMVSSVLVIWLNSPNDRDQRDDFFESTFQGVVMGLDVMGRGDLKCYFEDTSIVVNSMYFNSYLDIQAGDSLVKNSKSLVLYVYRFDDSSYVLIQVHI